jgi:hypothetical protein
MIHGGQNAEDFVEEYSQVLLCVLDGLDPNIEA